MAIMRRASLLIGKPGGLTSAEAMASGTPMLIIRPLPGQERGNTEMLVRNGAAQRLSVTLGKLEGDYVAVTSGLPADAQLIVQGAAYVFLMYAIQGVIITIAGLVPLYTMKVSISDVLGGEPKPDNLPERTPAT